MKKNILLLFFTFFIHHLSHSQSTFEKVIDTLGSSYASCVQQTFDGGFIVCGGSILGGNDVLIMKLDSTGIIEWVKTYSGSSMEGAIHIEQLPDSGYIVDAAYDAAIYESKIWLLRLDINGDTLWTKVLTAGVGKTVEFQMTVGNNGNYGLTGYFHTTTSTPYAYLILTNDSGVAFASNTYPSTYGSESHAINKANQNWYAISGVLGISAGNVDAYLILTDSVGDTLWTRSYDNSTTDVANTVQQTTDGGYIIAGYTLNNAMPAYNIYLIKSKSNGDTIWTKQYGGASSSGAYSVQQTSDGGYIITARIVNGSPLNANVWLLKINTNGDTLWTRQYGGIGIDEGYFVRQTNDNGFIICGITSQGNSGIYLIKTDSMGRVTTVNGTPEVNNAFVFSVYPNPSTSVFTVDLKGIPYNNADVEVYNLHSESIYHCTVNNHTTFQIDLHNQLDGMYVVTLITKEKIFSKKIILKK